MFARLAVVAVAWSLFTSAACAQDGAMMAVDAATVRLRGDERMRLSLEQDGHRYECPQGVESCDVDVPLGVHSVHVSYADRFDFEGEPPPTPEIDVEHGGVVSAIYVDNSPWREAGLWTYALTPAVMMPFVAPMSFSDDDDIVAACLIGMSATAVVGILVALALGSVNDGTLVRFG